MERVIHRLEVLCDECLHDCDVCVYCNIHVPLQCENVSVCVSLQCGTLVFLLCKIVHCKLSECVFLVS